MNPRDWPQLSCGAAQAFIYRAISLAFRVFCSVLFVCFNSSLLSKEASQSTLLRTLYKVEPYCSFSPQWLCDIPLHRIFFSFVPVCEFLYSLNNYSSGRIHDVREVTKDTSINILIELKKKKKKKERKHLSYCFHILRKDIGWSLDKQPSRNSIKFTDQTPDFRYVESRR